MSHLVVTKEKLSIRAKVRLEGLLQEVCREFDCSDGQIREKGRKRNKTRTIAWPEILRGSRVNNAIHAYEN